MINAGAKKKLGKEKDGKVLNYTVPLRFSKKDYEGILFRSLLAGKPEFVAFLGEYGSGKTTKAAARFLHDCVRNGIGGSEEELFSQDLPQCGIVGPTLSDLVDGPYRQFKRICPPELILKERFYGMFWDVELANGLVINFYTIEGAINGPNLTHIWMDEIQVKKYAQVWHNLQARVRDVRANQISIVASGLAEKGHVEDIFRYNQDYNWKVLLYKTEENEHNLAPGYLDELKKTLPASSFETDDEGWALPRDTYFRTFGTENFERQLSPDFVKKSLLPVSIGIDPRTHAGVIIGVKYKKSLWIEGQGQTEVDCLCILDELLPESQSAEKICDLIVERGWGQNLIQGRSRIFVDPTASLDEVNWFRNKFPGVQVSQTKAGVYSKVESRLNNLDWAIQDGKKVRRLYIAERLQGNNKRGCVAGLRNWKGNRDGVYEHIMDAVSYFVAGELPQPSARYSQEQLNSKVTGIPKLEVVENTSNYWGGPSEPKLF
jgi:hypothetical protein